MGGMSLGSLFEKLVKGSRVKVAGSASTSTSTHTHANNFIMSRGGRGGGRGGFGGNNPPPMGLTFQDIQALNREEDALYPVRALISAPFFIFERSSCPFSVF